MVGLLELLHLVSNSSDNSGKVLMIYVVLLITITWCVVDEFTLETPFFYSTKKRWNYLKLMLHENKHLNVLWSEIWNVLAGFLL